MTASDQSRDALLERALVINVVVHGLALLSMALLLLPSMPGGTNVDEAARVANIAAHPWLFRLGWFPWQLCAAGDLALGIAMVRTPWLPRASAVVALALTCIAVVPDQAAEALWITRGVELAAAGDVDAYLAFERMIFPWSAGWGALFYTLGALAWTWCFAKAGAWSPALSILSVPLWLVLLAASASPLLPTEVRPSSSTISFINGVGFLMLFPWLVLVTEQVLRRARPAARFGRHAPWRYPLRGPLGALVDAVANSRFLEVVLGVLPTVEMRSDITDVVYVNYLVPAATAAAIVPAGLELQRLGPSGEHALFTFLTYRHGAFGPSLLGPLRKLLLPSPLQSNWRVHVVDPRTGHRGIYFLTNAITRLPHALGARLLSAGMPMHVLASASIARDDGGALVVTCDPGAGSGPDLALSLKPSSSPPPLSGAWRECWPDFRAFLAYCVPQDRAMSTEPWRARVSRQEIDLGIPLDACTPLEGTVHSRAARAIVGDAVPLCFHVATVSFRFAVEMHD